MSFGSVLPPHLHRLAVRLIYGTLNVLQPPGLPATGAALSLNACFHTERLDDDTVFQALMQWCQDFRAITGVRPWLCLMTPRCPSIAARLRRNGILPEAYGERALALAPLAEIGYHGHFYTPDGEPAAGGRFTMDLASEQIAVELAWLRGLGLEPRVYTAGWWVVTPELLARLGGEGIVLDCSTRGTQAGTFGDRYLGEVPPVGRRFHLAGDVTGIGSLPYFSMPWPRYVRILTAVLPELGERSLWAALPLHDYSLVHEGAEALRTVKRLAALPFVRWVDVAEVVDARGTGPLAASAPTGLGDVGRNA